MMRRTSFVFGTALLASTLLGCGGGGGGGAELTKEQYIDEVEDICREQVDLISGISGPEDVDDFKSMLDDTTTIYELIDDRLSDLNPPPEAEAVHEALQDAVDTALKSVGKAKAAVEAEDLEKIEAAVNQSTEVMTAAVDQAEELGIETCAQL